MHFNSVMDIFRKQLYLAVLPPSLMVFFLQNLGFRTNQVDPSPSLAGGWDPKIIFYVYFAF